MAVTSSSPRRSGRGRLVGILIALLVVAVYIAAAVLYRSAQSASGVSLTGETTAQDRLKASVSTNTVDPVKGDLTLRILLAPEGALAAADGVSLTQPVDIQLNAATGKSAYNFKKGERINPIDVVVSLDSAGGSSYPFDRYTGEFLLVASTTAPAGADAAAGGSSVGASEVPVALELDASLPGYTVDANHNSTADAAAVDVSVSLHRAPATYIFAIGILALQVLIALGALTFAVMVATKRRKPEMAQLTWFSALLFALTPLRNAMPGVPPIGILADVLVYFWVVVAITAALLTVLFNILRPSPKG